MKYIIFGTHEYQWALWPFGYLFGKYWGKHKLIYVGDRQNGDLPDNIEFMQVPCYTEGIWPWDHWFGNGVRATLDIFSDKRVVIFLPDHWIRDQVDQKVIAALTHFMNKKENIVRGNLSSDTGLQGNFLEVAKYKNAQIVTCADYRHCGLEAGTAMSPAVWNRKLFFDLLEPHWDIWAIERLGTDKMRQRFPHLKSVGTLPPALNRVNSLRGRKRHKEVWLEGLKEEDRQIIREMLPIAWRVYE